MSGNPIQGGRLAVYRSDFSGHINGTSFRQNASTVDTIPGILGSTTVQDALQKLNTAIAENGSGFISIGKTDGYAIGSYNVGAAGTPTLATAFAAACADMRLQNGGVIFILEGSYNVNVPITVPSGISVYGSIEGSIINSQLTEQSTFIVSPASKQLKIGADTGGGESKTAIGSNIDCVKFYNLVICDNLSGSINSGHTTQSTVPMISAKVGSNIVLERVTFLGRVNNGSITGRGKTLSAISYIAGSGAASSLVVKDCSFDGVKLGIDFTGNSNNNLDFLTVSGCKARTYGSESGSLTSPLLNSFILSNFCNASIINNYHNGIGSQVKSFWTIKAGTPTNCNIVVSGNSGAPTSGGGTLVNNQTASTFTSCITGNQWGNSIDSTWYLTVSNGSGLLGDINGPDAINTVLSLGASSSYQATIIVNPGTYSVVGDGANAFANLKFIGNKVGNNYPIFQLNLETSGNLLGLSDITLGNHLEGIQFISVGSAPNSVRPSWNTTNNDTQVKPAYTLTVRDCSFINTCLYPVDFSAGPFLDNSGNVTKFELIVENCYFFQTGIYDDIISAALPPAHLVHLDSCEFYGSGYALSISNVQGFSSGSIIDTNIIIENVTCDLTGYSITDPSPLDPFNYYVIIDDNLAKVTLNNCFMVATNNFSQNTSIDASIGAERFISISARDIALHNSTFSGSSNTYTDGSVFAISNVFLEPREAVRIDKCRFLSGGTGLQISGTNTFNSSTNLDGIYITNSEFDNINGNCLTNIDIDIDVSSVGIGSHSPQIVIDNNTICSSVGTNHKVEHFNLTGANYAGQASVQIYANYFGVKLSNNRIKTTLKASSTYSHYSAVYIDSFNSATNSGVTISPVVCTNNTIEVINNYSSGTSTESSDCLLIISDVININNNYFGMNNTASISSSFIGNLWLSARGTAITNLSSGSITGNTFSRTTVAGTNTTLARGYIHIENNSNRGMITNNTFNSPTYDGSSTALIEDTTAGAHRWIVTQNINQTETINIRPWSGKISTDGYDVGPLAVIGGGTYSTKLTILENEQDTPGTLDIQYNGTGRANFMWTVDLFNYIPQRSRIITAVISGFSDTNPALTSGVFTFRLAGTGMTTLSSTLDFTGSYVTDTVLTSTLTTTNTSNANTYENNATDNIRVQLFSLSSFGIGGINGTIGNIKFSSIAITYRW